MGSKICKIKDLISPQWLRNVKSKKYPYWRIDTIIGKKKYFDLGFIGLEDGTLLISCRLKKLTLK